jgi:hypothetical protein
LPKKILLAVLTVIFLSSLLPLHPGIGLASPTTTIGVEPRYNFGLNIDDTFLVNITVTDVIDLAAWQLALYYESAVLNGTNYAEGPFLKSGGANTFFFVVNFTDNYNATHGQAFFACAIYNPGGGVLPGVDGTGTLASISFKVIGGGGSILHLDDTILDDSAEPPNHIPHTLVDGEAYAGIVDVAVSYIDIPINIAKGTMAHINVTAQNKGQMTETFDVTLNDDTTPIETKSVINLTAGGTTILNYTWDTTVVPIGEYSLIAIATPVPGEKDLSDNNLTLKIYVGTRDLAVTALKPYRTSIPIEFPEGVEVLVTIKNNGQATETFNVTLYQGSTELGNQTTALISGGSGSLTFTWNTSVLRYGNYSLWSNAVPLPYEMHISDNNLTTYAVVTIPGDTNGDLTVDIYDAIVLASAYEANPSSPSWNANADINGDNIVDIYDAIILSSHYGQSI